MEEDTNILKDLTADSNDEEKGALSKENVWENAQCNYDDISVKELMTDLKGVSADVSLGKQALGMMENLSFDKLIGEPLRASIKAQSDAARSTLSYIREVGIKEKGGKQYVAMVTFDFLKNGKMAKMSLPLLTLVPIPSLEIKEMSYTFKVKINTDSGINLVSGIEGGSNAWLGNQPSGSKDGTGKPSTDAKPGTEEKSTTNTIPATDGKPAADGKPSSDAKAPSGETKADTSKNESASSKDTTVKVDAGKSEDAAKAPTLDMNNKSDVAKGVQAVKNSVQPQIGFGASYSTKKDSRATLDSKYSIETNMDITIKAGVDDSLPGGIAKMLEVLNNSVEIIDTNGSLIISANQLSLNKGDAVGSISYKNGDGIYQNSAIRWNNNNGLTVLDNVDSLQLIFSKPGTFIFSAGRRKEVVVVTE